jgi:hypothetical protein
MTSPDNLSFSLEPQEGGKLVFLRLTPPEAGKSRASVIAFRLKISNDRAETVTLKEIRVTFPNSPVSAKLFTRDLDIAANTSKTTYLDDAETMNVPWPAPANIKVDLVFDGFDPLSKTLGLAQHKNPTPQGSYKFVGRPEHMEPNEYFYFEEHAGGGGQHFGYDIKCVGWNSHEQRFATYRGESNDTNESHFAWHQPIHALADGVVLKAVSGNPNNPRPGQNYVHRRGDTERGAATAIAITQLERLDSTDVSKARMLTAVRTASGKLKLIAFEQTEDGRQITDLGEAEGPAIAAGSEVSLAVVNKNRAVTSVVSGGTLTLTLWSISDDALTIEDLDVLTIPDTKSAKVARLSSTRIVTATRTDSGTFLLSIWKIQGNPLNTFQNSPMGQDSAGQVGVFDLVVLSSSRLATAVRTAEGNLKVIVWDLALANSNTETTVNRRGDTGSIEPVNEISASVTSVGNQLAAAVRTAAGNLKVFYWNIDSNGAITEAAQHEAGAATLVKISLFKKTTLATAVRTQAGDLRLSVWKLNLDTGTGVYSISREGDGDADGVGAIALARIDTAHTTMATAVQTANGNLKIILWQLARANGFLIRHGDAVRGFEVAGYWHMSQLEEALLQPGTIVTEGQRLGLLGNSGASGGPHLHLDVVKAPAGVSLSDLIEQAADGTWSSAPNDVPYRPISFHSARAMVANKLVTGGVWKNPFSVLDDDGIHFNFYAVFPGPATELAECNGIRSKVKALEAEIDELEDERKEAPPPAKAGYTAQIQQRQRKINELESKGIGIGCKI